MLRACLMLFLATLCGALRAHTVPVMVIEAEFDSARVAVLKVNLDPRLFLSDQPTTLPPVPASWWFEQDDNSKEKTKRQAVDYLARTLALSVGEQTLTPSWTIQPIDSASAFPLGQASAEAHVLAVSRLSLPAVPGGFQVSVAKACAVPVILLCSNTGDDANRRPEPLLAGERSRPFVLPALPKPTVSRFADFTLGATTLGKQAPLVLHHMLLALLLSWRWGGSHPVGRRLGLMGVFTILSTGASMGRHHGWLPEAPLWMSFAYAGTLLALVSLIREGKWNSPHLLIAVAVGGLAHGLCWPTPSPSTGLTAEQFTAGALVLLLGAAWHHRAARRQAQLGAGSPSR